MYKQKQTKEILGSTLLLCNGTQYASMRTLIRIQIFDAYQNRHKKNNAINGTGFIRNELNCACVQKSHNDDTTKNISVYNAIVIKGSVLKAN